MIVWISGQPNLADVDIFHLGTLKEFRIQLALHLDGILDESWVLPTLPMDWIKTWITSTFRSWSKWESTNYWRVSLTSVCGKFLLRIVHNKLENFLLDNDTLSNRQAFHQNGQRCYRPFQFLRINTCSGLKC